MEFEPKTISIFTDYAELLLTSIKGIIFCVISYMIGFNLLGRLSTIWPYPGKVEVSTTGEG